MNPAAASKGNHFAGAIGYITHDVGKGSTERVAHVEVLNMRTNDPEKAAKVMAWTAMHAGELKQAAGIKATGRKTTDPVYHFSVTWEPGEKIDHKDMVTAAKSALKELGFETHETVLAVHTDKPHPHIHVVVNRINPETGRTVNPKDDYNLLQRWAYGYEKAQGRVVCLDRALKFEKDPTLRAEYQKRLDAERQSGKYRDSTSRPQWEAEQEAKAIDRETYELIRKEFVGRIKSLSANGRLLAEARGKEWVALKSRHAEELKAFSQTKRTAAAKVKAFAKASDPKQMTWKQFQETRSAMRKRQTIERRLLKSQLKTEREEKVAAFKAGQKEAWKAFYRMERAARRPDLSKSLALVSNTPVSQHGESYRDHLARLFNAKVSAGERHASFKAKLESDRKAFYVGLAKTAETRLDRQKSDQATELKTLRGKFDQARATQKIRVASLEAAKVEQKQALADIRSRQAGERAAIKAKHDEQRLDQQKAWSSLHAERAAVFKTYAKAFNAAELDASREPSHSWDSPSLGDYSRSRAIGGRQDGRDISSGDGQGGGRERSRGPG